MSDDPYYFVCRLLGGCAPSWAQVLEIRDAVNRLEPNPVARVPGVAFYREVVPCEGSMKEET